MDMLRILASYEAKTAIRRSDQPSLHFVVAGLPGGVYMNLRSLQCVIFGAEGVHYF